MDWPMDELVTMDDDVSRWLADRGLPLESLGSATVPEPVCLSRMRRPARRLPPVDDPQTRAAIRVGLDADEDQPGIDADLVVPLFEQLAGAEPPGVVESLETAPTDLADRGFLGEQARAHGFSVSVGPTHVTVATPRDGDRSGASPA